jgi:hypothetical protein
MDKLYVMKKAIEYTLFFETRNVLNRTVKKVTSPMLARFSDICDHHDKMIGWFETLDEIVCLCLEKITIFCEKNLSIHLEKTNEIDSGVIDDMHRMMVIPILEKFDELKRATYPPYGSRTRSSQPLKYIVDEFRSCIMNLHEELIELNTRIENYLTSSKKEDVK